LKRGGQGATGADLGKPPVGAQQLEVF
jgi:hypothetical protein